MVRFTILVIGGVVLSGWLILSAVPVLGDSRANAAASPAEIQQAEEQDPKICKRFKPTGSNIAKRYCFRKSTWDAMREGGQRAMRDISDRASVNTSSGETSR